MICIILQAAFIPSAELQIFVGTIIVFFRVPCLEKYKSCFLIEEEEEEVYDPSLINKHQMKSGRSERAEM